MAHPFARSRAPAPSPACDDSFRDSDRAAPFAQADAEALAVREALHVTIYLRKLVALAQREGSAECDIHAPELLLLIAIVEAEFDRRMQAIMATLGRMRSV
ncbi:hypothetical protein ACQ858_06100 [Variovorax ureilyticus]|uniref:hypothetical protein n=1 Tax=Variovorax ureilyticus TaxID=1836198 RepID=UPI003D66B2D1